MIKKARGPGSIFGQTYGNGIWPAGDRKGRGVVILGVGVRVMQKGLGLSFAQRLARLAMPPRSPASSPKASMPFPCLAAKIAPRASANSGFKQSLEILGL